jgi:Protein of unknown function (DUF3024)
MAFSNHQLEEIKHKMQSFMAQRRPPEEIRDKVDLNYRVERQSVEIFEIRPQWRNPAVKIESLIAKTTYVKSKKVWKIYWMRALSG